MYCDESYGVDLGRQDARMSRLSAADGFQMGQKQRLVGASSRKFELPLLVLPNERGGQLLVTEFRVCGC